jgi:hypothetical protein
VSGYRIVNGERRAVEAGPARQDHAQHPSGATPGSRAESDGGASLEAGESGRHPTEYRPGDVVAWRSARTAGLGQLEHLDHAGRATVRTWWPAPTRTVVVPADRLGVLEDLTAAVHAAGANR